jgi:hypothetical protein
MSTANKYAPAVNLQPPGCPYCSTPLPEVSTFQWVKQIGGGLGVMLCIYCPNADCRKIMGTQIMIVPHAEEQHSIAGPH